MYTSTETTKKEMARFWTRDEWRSIRVLNSYFFGIAREKEMAVHTHPLSFCCSFGRCRLLEPNESAPMGRATKRLIPNKLGQKCIPSHGACQCSIFLEGFIDSNETYIVQVNRVRVLKVSKSDQMRVPFHFSPNYVRTCSSTTVHVV